MAPTDSNLVRKPSSSSLFSGTSKIITVKVFESADDSAAPEEYHIHADVLCKYSPFFEAALKDHWVEGATGVVPLHKIPKGVFGIFAQWLYRSKIYSCPPRPAQTSTQEESKSEKNDEHELLIKCYLTGELLQSVDFKDTVMDAYLEFLRATNTTGGAPYMLKNIWSKTPERSSLRRFVVDTRISTNQAAGVIREDDRHYYSEEILWEIVQQYQKDYFVSHQEGKLSNILRPRNHRGCKYHEHVALGLPCYKKRL